MNWFLLAFASLFMFAGITLIQKHLLNLGIHPIIFGLYLMAFTFALFLITAIVTKQNIIVPNIWIIFLILAGVLALFGNLAATYSFKFAENPGYTQAIISASGVAVLFASIFLFKSELTPLKLVGVLLTTIGIIFLGWK
ncbi:MAG: hypothetical protein QT10_C0001G0107 [archaeon GW2011_AR19]|nr:MAG: hypothetical protein QT10_C0001G0107 [archaeon GW2011_AR19]